MSVEHDATQPAVATTVTDAGRATPPVITGDGLAAGMRLAHFRLDERIGRGGMGEVWRATDVALDRPVALKVLPAEVAGDPDRRERMLREARAQARLQHPNVCHIYYVGEDAGVVFFAMELVVGESLAQRLARGAIAPEEAVALVRQAALGLREAQRHGFLHRDVKPSNLMVDREGRVKVVDFGLVKAGPAPTAGEPGEVAATAMVGTPLYMAPEQAAGEAIDARADIYALGATLHHLVSGKPPFEGASMDELATQHRDAARPRLAASGPRRERRVASTLEPLIARMMAKRRDDRYAGYDALIGELERVSPAHTRPAGVVVRTIALFIDLLAVTVMVVPLQLVPIGPVRDVVGHQAFAATFAMLYVTIAVSRWGQTVGRWLLDIEVIDMATGRRPTPARAALRAVVAYGPLWLALQISAGEELTGYYLPIEGSGLIALVAVAWGSIVLLYAGASPDKRTTWDRVARTMTRYRSG